MGIPLSSARFGVPWLGTKPVKAVSAPELLSVLRRIEAKGALETAHRVKQVCGQVFRYAIATGRAERDPSGDLRGAIPPASGKHMATITDPKEIGGLLRSIDDYRGNIVTRCALQLAPLVFVRPGELRQAEWSEFDLEMAEWRIPAEKMKAGAVHIVPLSRQALGILREIHPLTGHGRYVFPRPGPAGRKGRANGCSATRRCRHGLDFSQAWPPSFQVLLLDFINNCSSGRKFTSRCKKPSCLTCKWAILPLLKILIAPRRRKSRTHLSGVKPDTSLAGFEKALEGKVLGTAKTTGYYGR